MKNPEEKELEDSNLWKEFKKLDRFGKKLVVLYLAFILFMVVFWADNQFKWNVSIRIWDAVLWAWVFGLIMACATTNWSRERTGDEDEDE